MNFHFRLIGYGFLATQLRFDFEFFTPTGSAHIYVASLLDPDSGAPLLHERVLGTSDAAFLEAISPKVNLLPREGVTAKPIPEPSSMRIFSIAILGMIAYSWYPRKQATYGYSLERQEIKAPVFLLFSFLLAIDDDRCEILLLFFDNALADVISS